MRKTDDGQTARYMRKKYKNEGQDEEEQLEDMSFAQNPYLAIAKHGKARTQKNLEKQIQYFGNAIQPFNMRQQQEIGEVDEQGYFIFNRKRKVKDAWLDSIGQAEDNDVADKLVKKIKQESRFKSVYQAGEQLNRNCQKQQSEDQEEENIINQQEQQQESSSNKSVGLLVEQLIEIMAELIPERSNANNYMKKLKRENKLDQYNKLLAISNQYIEKTGQYDILTKKKEDLQEMLDQIREKKMAKIQPERKQQGKANEKQSNEPIVNWDESESEDLVFDTEKGGIKVVKIDKQDEAGENKSEQGQEWDDDSDNIF